MSLQFLYENLSSSQIYFVLLVIIVVILLFFFSIRPFQTPNYIEEGRTDIFTNKTKKKLRKTESVPDNGSKIAVISKDKKRNVTKTSDLRKRILDHPDPNSGKLRRCLAYEEEKRKKEEKLNMLALNKVKILSEQSKVSRSVDNHEENNEGWTEVLSPKERQKRSRQSNVEHPIVQKQEPKTLTIKDENEIKSGKSNSPIKQQDKKSTKKPKNAKSLDTPTELPDDINKENSESQQNTISDIPPIADLKSTKTTELSSNDESTKKASQKKKNPSAKTVSKTFEIAAFSIPSASSTIESSTVVSKVKEEEEEDEVVAHLVSLKQKQAANRQKESSSSSDSLIEGFEIVEKSYMKDEEVEPAPSPSSGASRRKNKKDKKKDTSYAATVSKLSDEKPNDDISNETSASPDLDTQDWCQVSEAKRKKKSRRVD